jgi:hypothetical protein
MLAEMLEYCPAGESTTAVFAFLYLQRLPREIRVLLSEDDPANIRAIAEKADRLIAMHTSRSLTTHARRSPLTTLPKTPKWSPHSRGLGAAKTKAPGAPSRPYTSRRS